MAEKAEWRVLEDQLDRLFCEQGVIGRKVFDLQNVEGQIGVAIVGKYKGWQILSDSFKSFYIETFQELKVPRQRPYAYADFIARHTRYFLALRAGELLFLHGYPLQGYSLMRSLVEQALLRAAIFTNIISFSEVEGLGEDGEPFSHVNNRRKRVSAERKVFAKMVGKESGLSEKTIVELQRWDDMFDLELHGLRLSLTETGDWLKGVGGLNFMPQLNETNLAMFMNRFAEVGWMLHRLIPIMQLESQMFSSQWAEKWCALDRSFKGFADGLTQIGKPIGGAIVELVNAKFLFSEKSHFPV